MIDDVIQSIFGRLWFYLAFRPFHWASMVIPSGNGIGGRRRITEIFLRTTEMSGRAEEDSSDRMTTADDLDLPPV